MDFGSDLKFVKYGSGENSRSYTVDHLFPGYYGIQIVTEGRIRIRTGENHWETASGPVAFITFPGVPFSYGSPRGEGRSHCFFCIEGKRVEEYIRSGLLVLRETQLLIPISDMTMLRRTADALLRNLLVPGNAIHHARTVHLLEELMLQISEAGDDTAWGNTPYRAQIRTLCSHIADAPHLEWDFNSEARKMQLSYAHFRRLFQRETAFSPKQYLLECRLRLAEKLLISGRDRISEIAESCGFASDFHLYRIFKKHRSLSPTSYRKLYGK